MAEAPTPCRTLGLAALLALVVPGAATAQPISPKVPGKKWGASVSVVVDPHTSLSNIYRVQSAPNLTSAQHLTIGALPAAAAGLSFSAMPVLLAPTVSRSGPDQRADGIAALGGLRSLERQLATSDPPRTLDLFYTADNSDSGIATQDTREEDPRRLAAKTLLGQELTIVPSRYLRPIEVAGFLSERLGGVASEVEPNGKAHAGSRLGIWVVEHDGKVPGGAPIIEVATPPLDGEAERTVQALLPELHRLGEAIANVGGGHIHIDGVAFLASPGLLRRFLSLYLHVEPALLAAFRHPARAHAARGFCEFPDSVRLGAELLEAAAYEPEGLPKRLESLMAHRGLKREMALNLRSLAGVLSGKKKSKGTLELRLFNSPKNPAQFDLQRRAVRLLIAAAFGSGPLPHPSDEKPSGIDDALAALERSVSSHR